MLINITLDVGKSSIDLYYRFIYWLKFKLQLASSPSIFPEPLHDFENVDDNVIKCQLMYVVEQIR